jgi:hypothetical protein
MAFLRDAHENRGILRQVGAVYQFKHAELQHHLAARPARSRQQPPGARSERAARPAVGHHGWMTPRRHRDPARPCRVAA